LCENKRVLKVPREVKGKNLESAIKKLHSPQESLE
jgi:hypothetical protein